MTPMPASPFMNSGAHVPEAPGSAAADQVAPQVAAAEPIADPDGGYMVAASPISAASSDNHIHEIFHYVRKLMKQPPAFVLDEGRFLADIDEEPLFLRADGYLQRREA